MAALSVFFPTPGEDETMRRDDLTIDARDDMALTVGAHHRRPVAAAGPDISYTLTGANTMGSYRIRTWTTYGGVRPTIVVGGHAITVTDAAAYEVYNTGSGVGVRQIG